MPRQNDKGALWICRTLNNSFHRANNLPIPYGARGIDPEITGGNFEAIPRDNDSQLRYLLRSQRFKRAHLLLCASDITEELIILCPADTIEALPKA